VADRWAGGVERAVRLTPRRGDGATVELVFTGFPGVAVRAGHGYTLLLPHCGCDACAEAPSGLARDLTETVEAIAGGGLTESRRRRWWGRHPFSIEVRSADGCSSASGTIEPGDEHDILPDGATTWAAWPERTSR
ncbi:MAG TPA: DUF6226 family protein, partial [Iamia sp.]|nr:DUF6226 family protein [Iamia sp.]